MRPCLFFTVACFITLRAAAQAPEKPAPKEVPPETKKLFQSTPEEFIKRFDKNMNGTLEKDELPPKLAERFEKVDANGDGKLDRKEVAQWLSDIRKRLGIAEPGGLSPVDKMVNALLLQFDTNKDGKLSKDEAKGRMAENFDLLDKNKDGFLDRRSCVRSPRKSWLRKKAPSWDLAQGPLSISMRSTKTPMAV